MQRTDIILVDDLQFHGIQVFVVDFVASLQDHAVWWIGLGSPRPVLQEEA
ncbi:MAG: hypothetical protein KDA20_02050 [Phycisphaerales bacterium]|nr:hypothetical protein [Phycisphaerales bacterium]